MKSSFGQIEGDDGKEGEREREKEGDEEKFTRRRFFFPLDLSVSFFMTNEEAK
jgi:hypothetical protein